MGRRGDHGPGSRGRAGSDPAPTRHWRRDRRSRGPGPAARPWNARDGEASEVRDGAEGADDVGAELVCHFLLGAFRGSESLDVRDPGSAGPLDRLGHERDSPLATKSPRVGLRQVEVLNKRRHSRERPRLFDATEPGLLVLAHQEPVEVPGGRPRATRLLCPISIVVSASAGRQPARGENQRHG